MNSLKFLAVNASLETGREVVGRFQMREECLLPRFGGANPEGSDRSAVSAAPSRPAWWRGLFRWFRKTRAERPGDSNEARSPSAFDTPPPELHSSQPTMARLADPSERAPVANREPEPAGPQGAVQAEFRFENVKVVCNDLHDADFEIVSRPQQGRRVNSGIPAAADLLVSV